MALPRTCAGSVLTSSPHARAAIDFNEYKLSDYDYGDPATLVAHDDAPVSEPTEQAYKHILNLMQNVCSALTATSTALANKRT